MKKGVLIGLCAIVVLFVMCQKETENEDNIQFSTLFGKTYIVKIVKVATSPDVQFPGDPLQERDYTPTHEVILYYIEFSDDGERVAIKPGIISGKRKDTDEKYLHYELDEGLFAGGRFLIWINNGNFEIEYTMYGSGVPVIKSERGILQQATK